MDTLTVSINETVGVNEILLPVVFINDAWNYYNNQPVASIGIHEAYNALSITNYRLSSTRHFVGHSFSGDGRYLRRVYIPCLYDKNVSTVISPGSAKVYAKLYSHSGTYGSGTPSSVLATSTNYYTADDIANHSSNTSYYTELIFEFDGTYQLAAGTKYFIGLYTSEISSGYLYGLWGYGGTHTEGNGAYISNLGVATLNTAYTMSFAVIGERNRFDHYARILSPVTGTGSGITVSPDGLNVYYSGSRDVSNYYRVAQYKLSTPWDFSSGSYWGLGPQTSTSAPVYRIVFSPDGYNVYLLDINSVLRHYRLSTPYDISTYGAVVSTRYLTWMQGLFGASADADFAISRSGDRAFVTLTSEPGDIIRQFDLSTPWDISDIPSSQTSRQFAYGSVSGVAGSYNLYGGSGTYEALAQTVVPGSDISVASVILYGYTSSGGAGLPSDHIYAEIVSSLDGTPIATSETISPNGNRYAYYTYVELLFPDNPTLTSGQTYYIQIKRTGSRDTTNGYLQAIRTIASGDSAYIKNSGVWTNAPTSALALRLTSGVAYQCDGKLSCPEKIFAAGASAGYTAGNWNSGIQFSPDGRTLIYAAQFNSTYAPRRSTQFQPYIIPLSTPWDITSCNTAGIRNVAIEFDTITYGYAPSKGYYISPNGGLILMPISAGSPFYIHALYADNFFISRGDSATITESVTNEGSMAGETNDSVGITELAGGTLVESVSISDIFQILEDSSGSADTSPLLIYDQVSTVEVFRPDAGIRFPGTVYKASGSRTREWDKQGGSTAPNRTTRGGNKSGGINTLQGGSL